MKFKKKSLFAPATFEVLRSYLNTRLMAAILDRAKQGILPLRGILLDKSNKNRSLDLPLSSAFEIRLRKMRTTDDFSQILYPKNCARTVSVMKLPTH